MRQQNTKRLIVILPLISLISITGINIGCMGEAKMSTLTETQIELLYGRKQPFVPSGYRIRIQEELGRAIRRAQVGRFTASQVGEVVRNIEKEKPLVKILLPEPREKIRGGVRDPWEPRQWLPQLPRILWRRTPTSRQIG